MKSRLLYLPTLCLVVFISGCFMGELSNSHKMPKYQAPPGAHFVKPGMAREERLRDFAACVGSNLSEYCRRLEGQPQAFAACKSRCQLNACFTDEQIEKASEVKDKYIIDKHTDAYFMLLGRLNSCMASKGYHQVPSRQCEGDEEYQPLCMWP